jgi:hypothetical protein
LWLQVYTFALQPVLQGSAESQQQQQNMWHQDLNREGSHDEEVAGWELHLLMEYCEEVSACS